MDNLKKQPTPDRRSIEPIKERVDATEIVEALGYNPMSVSDAETAVNALAKLVADRFPGGK